jgi:hypothetical protein
MITTWLLYACGIMFVRLVYLPGDGALSRAASVSVLCIQLTWILLLFEFTAALGGLAVLLILVALVAYGLENPVRIRRGFRLMTLAAQLLPVFWVLDLLSDRVWTAHIPADLLLAAFGILVLANEANHLVRLLFHWCNLEPKLAPAAAHAREAGPVAQKVDEEEYKAGRVIGMLERSLIFLIIYFSGDFSAVGFMLAAKGLVRIRQLRDRQFSEYLLIGTLASAICAVIVALVLRLA